MFNFLEMVDYIIKCSFSLAFIVITSPYLFVLVALQLVYFYFLRKRILKIARDCFKLKQVLNSPIISLIQDALNGQVTMRALGMQPWFINQFMKFTDTQTRAFVTSNGVSRYTAFRIDM